MASIKVKFRQSKTNNREGTIYYQVLHNILARQINTSYKLYREEWDDSSSHIISSPMNQRRDSYLQSLRSSVKFDMNGH